MAHFDKEDREEHESFGQIEISRVSSLRIKNSIKYRDLHRNWHHSDKEIIEVAMSENQFAQMITSLNVGSGSLCTIKHIQGHAMEECPEENERETFEKEFEEKMKGIGEEAKELVGRAKQLLEQPSLRKSEREELLKLINGIVMTVTNSVPFTASQYNEFVDKTLTSAKNDIDAHLLNLVNKAGLKSLQDAPITVPALEPKKEGK